ncbi:MAG: calcium/sodium antiporter [Zhongshania sp.]|uniref:calcium/sodium antiporter n=1 Tax=Zhongshania sp. TaxID=1971902 RepID=UPI002606F6E4|nr:calcium/sodium antiporter [Zhongshania sp.]MDF1690866.1 calcium/sodium antiporter [Zhongshania sp.]
MTLALMAILGGFVLLIWSADRFVEGAAATAKHLGMPSLLIGMVIVGFGTSAPEMVVSAIASLDGNPDLALGNAIGSNIVNIGLILGITALISPISVHSNIVRKELPLLTLIGGLVGFILWDGALTRFESLLLLAGFIGLVSWTIFVALRTRGDHLETETDELLIAQAMPIRKALFWLVMGLVALIISSRILVWGAVTVAHALGVSDLIIGLTIVAFGTSLPELAASIIAVRRGEHDIAIGNVVGSNMFNLLAVIGIAGVINPMSSFPADIISRDWAAMMLMTIGLLVMTFGLRKTGQLNRLKGGILLISFVGYNVWLLRAVMS